jgi:nitroreductase
MMDVSEAIATRKSVRAYENKPILADILKRIIEAGQWAPNAGPFQISLIQNAGLRQRINDRALDVQVS